MLFIGEKVGIAAQQESPAARPAEGRHRRRSARGHEPLRDRRAERDGGARGVEPRRAAARARSLHGKARRRTEFQARRQPRRERRREPRRHRAVARAGRRGPRRHRARSAAARAAHRGHPGRGRAHPAHQRRRPLGGHCGGGRRKRRPRGHGHRRRAGRRADGGGHAVPERRDLRASRRQHARARGALPGDGDHGFPQHLHVEGSRLGRRHHLCGHRRHRRHADERRAVLRRRRPHELAHHAEPSRRASGSSTRFTSSRSGWSGYDSELAQEPLRRHRRQLHRLHRLHAGDAVPPALFPAARRAGRRRDRDVVRAEPRRHARADRDACPVLGAAGRSLRPEGHGRALAGELRRRDGRPRVRDAPVAGVRAARGAGIVRRVRRADAGDGGRLGAARSHRVRDRLRADGAAPGARASGRSSAARSRSSSGCGAPSS